MAIGIIAEQNPTKLPSLLKKRDYRNNKKNKNCGIEIEVEWKEPTNRHVHFDPDLDWKNESSKSEQGQLRRLAEKEIRKRLDSQKGKKPRENPELQAELLLTRGDRQKEAFLYICFSEVDLLVEQYEHHKSSPVLKRMFDRLFEEAGIKPRCERTSDNANGDTSDSSSWLWTCFLALQLEYRRVYESNSQISSRTKFLFPHQPFVSGLGRKADEALFFAHWLSPAFRYEGKESKQRRVYDSILGDATAMAKFEDYLFCEANQDNQQIRDLRAQVHGFFESMLYSSLVSSPEGTTTDLGTFFLAIREADAGSVVYPCEWSSCCEDRPRRSMFPYHALTCESKHRLFLISAMPAYRAYLVKPSIEEKQELIVASSSSPRGPSMESPTFCSELLQFGFSGKSKIQDDVLEEQDPRSLVVTDTTSDVHHCEYEFSNELCNLLFESA